MKALERLLIDMADLQRRVQSMARPGTVAEVDAAAGTVRLKIGVGDDGDFLSAPVPYAQIAGALKVHSPPSEGQQMILFAPSGDLKQSVAMPLTFSSVFESPSTADDRNVLTFGDVTLTLAGASVEIEIGGVTVNISGSGLSIVGGTVTHNGKNIGDTHTHSGVTGGPSNTGVPN